MPRYEGPVVDAHHHFWEPAVNDHPWLRPESHIPFRYGNYDAIKRAYLPPDYLADAAGQDVRQTVYMETEWNPADPVGEIRYASGLAERFGLPSALIGAAPLDRADVAEILDQETVFPLLRSIRHKPGGPAAPGEAGRTLMSDETWRRGYALLEKHNLNFDLQTPWWNFDEAIALARDFPATLIILNHTGLPSDRSEAGLAGWHKAMGKLAAMSNLRVKISGIGQKGRKWTVADNGWIVRETIAMFGAERCAFASNFPVDGLCGSFSDIFGGFRDITADLSPTEQARLFCGTAREIYHLPPLPAAPLAR
jgi:predicted TIM-barrel fold metal-dependent hydrolase